MRVTKITVITRHCNNGNGNGKGFTKTYFKNLSQLLLRTPQSGMYYIPHSEMKEVRVGEVE